MADDGVVLLNFEALIEKAQLGVIEGLNQAALEFSVRLAAELPDGVAAKSIVVKPSNRQGDKFTVTVGIENEGVLKYLWAYWKGEPEIITISGHPWMRFDRWKNGPSELRWRKDNLFHFKTVKHEYLAHDFVERAIAKFDTFGETIIRKFNERVK